jgi:hypothetical protein
MLSDTSSIEGASAWAKPTMSSGGFDEEMPFAVMFQTNRLRASIKNIVSHRPY